MNQQKTPISTKKEVSERPEDSARSDASGTLPAKQRPAWASLDLRQVAVFVLALVLLTAAVAIRASYQTSSTAFVSAAMFRISLVLLAVAFAWQSLRRPASWLPPGMAAFCLVGLGVLAAQPRLIFVLGPLVGGLCVIGALMRTFRKR